MEVERIAEGLWRWSTFFGEWGQDVGCVFVEADDAIVLIDPLVPEEPAEAERFWGALDRDVQRAGAPVHVLVTVFWHTRSSGEVVRRYGGTLHVASGARSLVARRADVDLALYRAGDPLPAGIVAVPTPRRSEVVLWLPSHRAIVPGDVILGAEDGGLRFCPPSWLPSRIDHELLREALLPLLELPVERVLVSHGAPVLEQGHAALERLLRGA